MRSEARGNPYSLHEAWGIRADRKKVTEITLESNGLCSSARIVKLFKWGWGGPLGKKLWGGRDERDNREAPRLRLGSVRGAGNAEGAFNYLSASQD